MQKSIADIYFTVVLEKLRILKKGKNNLYFQQKNFNLIISTILSKHSSSQSLRLQISFSHASKKQKPTGLTDF